MEGCKSDDYKQSRIVPLSLDEFQVLMEQIYEKYKKDWNTHYKGKKTHLPIPDYKNKRDKDRFHNYKKKEAGFIDNESLGFFMLKNECIKECCRYHFHKEEFTRKNLYDNYQKYERAIKEKKLDAKIELGKGYSFIFFHYINIDSYTDFKEKFKAGIEEKRITDSALEKNTIHDVSAISERAVYYFVGLRVSEQRVVESKFHIDFETGNVVMETENEVSYSGGKLVYKYPYLEIRFDRKYIDGDEWIPFTAYFEVKRNLKKLPFLSGIACGASYNEQRAIAGNYVLVKKEHYSKYRQKIHRYLFQQNHGIEVYISRRKQAARDIESNFSSIESGSAVLEGFIGEHELFNIGRKKEELLRSYIFKIQSNFYGHITSFYDEYEYKARFRVTGTILLIDIEKIYKNDDAKRYSVLSNIIIIDRESSFEFDGYKAFEAKCLGESRDGKMEGFPMLLLMNPKESKPKRINKKDISEFLKAETYNKNILRILLELERKRIDLVEEMFEGIDLEAESNT